MANYSATSRTNFFRVKNPKFFEFCMGEMNIPTETLTDANGETQYMILGEEEYGSFPSSVNNSGVILEIKSSHFSGEIFILEENYNSDLKNAVMLQDFIQDGKIVGTEEVQEIESIDVANWVFPHLQKDSIAVCMEAGGEASRYVLGWAKAISHKGEKASICLDLIYKEAAKKFNLPIENIAKCEYTEHKIATS